MLVYRGKTAYGVANESYRCLEFVWFLGDEGEKVPHEHLQDFETNGMRPLSEVVDNAFQEIDDGRATGSM